MSTNSLAKFFESFESPEGVRVEFLDGEIIMQADPLLLHDLVGREFVLETPKPFEAWQERGIFVSDNDRPRADAAIIRRGDSADTMRDFPASIVLAVMETVSSGRAAVRRDYEDKREKYEGAGIPVYVIVDPRIGEWIVLLLEDGKYAESARGTFGTPIPLPEPLDFAIPTSSFHRYPPDAG